MTLKHYYGRVPACGVFCGGCPTYIRDKKPCPGAETNIERCEKCTIFHPCCEERKISHCHQCSDFPCAKFKRFTKSWLKYGQNFIDNQKMIKELGIDQFLKHYNSKV
jgi:hypothetical protein